MLNCYYMYLPVINLSKSVTQAINVRICKQILQDVFSYSVNTVLNSIFLLRVAQCKV